MLPYTNNYYDKCYMLPYTITTTIMLPYVVFLWEKNRRKGRGAYLIICISGMKEEEKIQQRVQREITNKRRKTRIRVAQNGGVRLGCNVRESEQCGGRRSKVLFKEARTEVTGWLVRGVSLLQIT